MITPKQKSELIQFFQKKPVTAIYLYGSVAKDKNDQLSDYDLGMLFSDKLSSEKRFDLRLRFFSEIAKILKLPEDKIDIVDLNEAPVLLQFNIISGILIYSSNEEQRVVFETYVMGRYNDEHYYYDRYIRETLEKIKKGVYFDRSISYS